MHIVLVILEMSRPPSESSALGAWPAPDGWCSVSPAWLVSVFLAGSCGWESRPSSENRFSRYSWPRTDFSDGS